ncbi:kinase-like domain-containing protein [Hyaloraphidium curvatum]|nr:kinase-like domain-containing protein [Hyaloraphidium curvatum]
MAGGRGVDIAFVVDVTGSMAEYLAFTKRVVRHLVTETSGGIFGRAVKVRVGGVFYRDFKAPASGSGPAKSFVQPVDFAAPEDVLPIFDAVKTESGFGHDISEDVLGALKAAAALSWAPSSRTTRVLFHILDAPPHGELFWDPEWKRIIKEHNMIYDTYPDMDAQDPAGIRPSEYGTYLTDLLQGKRVTYFYLALHDAAVRAGDIFKDYCRTNMPGRVFETLRLDTKEETDVAFKKFQEVVLTSTMSSIRLNPVAIEAGDIDYDKKDRLGAGGFGEVFKGRLGNSLVAVKTIKKEAIMDLGPDVIEAFLQELDLWKTLSHKNVLKLRAYCEEPPMLIAELADGGNLSDYLGKLGWDQRRGIELMGQVAAGMEYLHGRKTLHGDLKAANILVVGGRAKIGDLGMARFRRDLDASGRMSALVRGGTPGYMAPEMLTKEGRIAAVQKWTKYGDVYAFGMTCVELLLKGKLPGRHARDAEGNLKRPEGVGDAYWEFILSATQAEYRKRPEFPAIVSRWPLYCSDNVLCR